MTVYGDVVFAVNAVPDFLLLLLGARLCGYPVRRWRAAVAAAVGGLYAVAVVLPVPPLMRTAWCRALCYLVMAAVAYGVRLRAIRPAFLTLLCGAAFAGVAYALAQIFSAEFVTLRGQVYYPASARMLLILAGVFYLAAGLLAAGAARHGSRETVPLYIACGKNAVTVTALYDTGNTLRDPVSGQEVIVLDGGYGKELVGSTPTSDASAWVQSHPELKPRLVPYRAVGTDGGLLAAVPCRVRIGRKKEQNALVALSPNGLSDGGGCGALIGGMAV
ncbi:MAG: sigma-E processing peptidase SpoIIGA [Oscillospiraceae bacterium]|nr:sigma-E processing peptidase SpoIIGA [Oscillospiraceae bacterium]